MYTELYNVPVYMRVAPPNPPSPGPRAENREAEVIETSRTTKKSVRTGAAWEKPWPPQDQPLLLGVENLLSHNYPC